MEKVINYERDRGLREPVVGEGLVRAGVAPSMTPRTLRAIAFLGLIDEEGYRTEDLDKLRKAATAEVPGLLRTSMQRAYADVIRRVDPATATDGELVEAFRGYEPSAQRHRMIALFRGLCHMSGLLPVESKPTAAPRRVSGTRAPAAHNAGGPRSILLATLLEALPRRGRWTSEERSRWLQAWTAAIDLLYGIDVVVPSLGGERPALPTQVD